MSPFLGPQPWEAPDPLPVMRRELKLLLIEMNLLRIEVEQSRSIREEARAREAFFSASVKQLTEGRDKWRREAERLRDLMMRAQSKFAFIQKLQSPTGMTIAAMMKETGWQQHSVRGFLAGVVRKKLKLELNSRKIDGSRVYRVDGSDSAKPSSGQSKRRAA